MYRSWLLHLIHIWKKTEDEPTHLTLSHMFLLRLRSLMTSLFSFWFFFHHCPQFFSDTFYMWYIIPLMTIACGAWALYQTLLIVVSGGVGKNGSTVAVSWCCVVWGAFFFCCCAWTSRVRRVMGEGWLIWQTNKQNTHQVVWSNDLQFLFFLQINFCLKRYVNCVSAGSRHKCRVEPGDVFHILFRIFPSIC